MGIEDYARCYATLAGISVEEAEAKIKASFGSFRPSYVQREAAKKLGVELDVYA